MPEPVSEPFTEELSTELPPVFSLDDIFRVQAAMVAMCEERRDRIAVLDAPFAAAGDETLGPAVIRNWRSRFDSTYAALYYPWIRVSDPLRSAIGLTRDIPPSGQLSVHYKTATFADGSPPSEDGGIVGGGCKAVAEFTAQMRAPLQANCTSCHAGANSGATGATDMTLLGDDTQQAEACAQILSRVSKLNPDQSSILESVRPGSPVNHPFKFPTQGAFDTYRAGALVWINLEAAP